MSSSPCLALVLYTPSSSADKKKKNNNNKNKNQNKKTFHLPSELLPHIMTYMDASSLCLAGSVCHTWRAWAEEDHLWVQLCWKTWGLRGDSFAPPPDPTKKLYQMHYGSLRAMLFNDNSSGTGSCWGKAQPSVPRSTAMQAIAGMAF